MLWHPSTGFDQLLTPNIMPVCMPKVLRHHLFPFWRIYFRALWVTRNGQVAYQCHTRKAGQNELHCLSWFQCLCHQKRWRCVRPFEIFLSEIHTHCYKSFAEKIFFKVNFSNFWLFFHYFRPTAFEWYPYHGPIRPLLLENMCLKIRKKWKKYF